MYLCYVSMFPQPIFSEVSRRASNKEAYDEECENEKGDDGKSREEIGQESENVGRKIQRKTGDH